MYLEQGAATAGPIGPPGAPGAQAEACGVTVSILFEFWGKVTPCILQLVSHTKVVQNKCYSVLCIEELLYNLSFCYFS